MLYYQALNKPSNDPVFVVNHLKTDLRMCSHVYLLLCWYGGSSPAHIASEAQWILLHHCFSRILRLVFAFFIHIAHLIGLLEVLT